MRSSIKKLYCTPIFKNYYEYSKLKNKIIDIEKLISKNLDKKNKFKYNNLNSYKYMYQGLVKK